MKRIPALLAAAAIMTAVVPASAPAGPPCWPHPSCPAGDHEIRDVFVVNASFTPEHIPDVRYGRDWLGFLNLDTVAHSVTDVRCVDADDATPCAFDIALTPLVQDTRQWQQGGNTVVVGAPNPFEVGSTYGYLCRIHDGMTGSFTVVL